MIGKLRNNSNRIRGNVASGEMRCSVRLDPKQMEQCQSLLKGQDQVLSRNELTVKEMEDTVAKLMVASGLGNEEGRRKPLTAILDDENKLE